MFREERLKRLLWRPKVLVVGLLLVLLPTYIAVTFVASIGGTQADLSIYYLAASRLSQGLDPYPWQLFLDAAQGEIFGPMPLRDYIYQVPDRGLLYPPLFAVLFMPLSYLGYGQVRLIWWVVNNLLLLVSIILTVRILGGRIWSVEGGLVAIIYLGILDLHHAVALGQINLLQFALLLLYHWSLKAGRKILAGWLLGLAMVIRPTFVVLFPLYLLWKREYKTFLWAALSGGLLFLAPLPLVGLEVYESFLHKMTGGDVSGVFAAKHNQSLAGFFYSLAFPDRLMSSNNGPLGQGPIYVPFPQFSYYLMAVVLLAITALYVSCGRTAPRSLKEPLPNGSAEPSSRPAGSGRGLDEALPRGWPNIDGEFSLVLIITLLISPLTWYHYYAVVAFPFATATLFLIRQQERRVTSVASGDWQVWVALGLIYYVLVGRAGFRFFESEYPILTFVTLIGAFALWCFIIYLMGGGSNSYQGAYQAGQKGFWGALKERGFSPLVPCVIAASTLLLLSIALVVYGAKEQKGQGVFFQGKSRPLISEDTLNGSILIVTQDGKVHAVEVGTGRVVWQHSFQGRPLCAPPAAHEDTVYVSSCWGDLYAVSPQKGMVWKERGFGMIAAQPLISGDSLYVGSLKKELVALKRDTGQVRWRYQTGGYISSSPLVVGNKLIFGSGDGLVHALDAETGEVIWEVSLGASLEAGVVASDGKIYVPTRAGQIYEMSIGGGEVLQRIEIGSPIIARPALSPEGSLYVGAIDGGLYAVDLVKGKVKWRAATGGAIMVSPVVVQGAVYVGSLDRRLYAFDTENGSVLWSKETGSWITTSPAFLDETVYMASDDNKVYAVRPDLIK